MVLRIGLLADYWICTRSALGWLFVAACGQPTPRVVSTTTSTWFETEKVV